MKHFKTIEEAVPFLGKTICAKRSKEIAFVCGVQYDTERNVDIVIEIDKVRMLIRDTNLLSNWEEVEK